MASPAPAAGGHDFLIAFSCQGRGVCPSCNTRRVVATAAHLTDHLLPPLPVRQWVLAVPKRLRYFLHRDAGLQGAALRLFLRAHSPGSGPAARLGAVAFIHRFGSTLNPHLHFHCVVIDGVFDATPTGGVVFHAATGPEANAIAQVQAQVPRRVLRVFVRRGALPDDDARAMGQWQHGGGFSVDGSVRIEAADRAGRERLLRYYARPPFTCNGYTNSIRRAALVPPRLHRHRYVGAPVRTTAYRKSRWRPRPSGTGRDRESHRLLRSGLPQPVTGLTPAGGRAPARR